METSAEMWFQHYLDGLNPKTQAKVRERLRQLARVSPANNQMWSNLLAEGRLTRRDCGMLCRSIGCGHVTSAEEVQRLIRGLCRKSRPSKGKPRCLSGEPASEWEDKTIFFRVVTLDRLADFFYETQIFETFEDAELFLLKAVGAEPDTIGIWASWPLGKHLMWSSFVPCQEGPPFDAPELSASEFMCCLGLDPVDGPLLLLQFKLSDACPPHVPTFWDAYAAEVWNLYFRVRPEGEPYGLTMPTKDCPQPARPEVVHEVIEAKHLVSPLRFI